MHSSICCAQRLFQFSKRRALQRWLKLVTLTFKSKKPEKDKNGDLQQLRLNDGLPTPRTSRQQYEMILIGAVTSAMQKIQNAYRSKLVYASLRHTTKLVPRIWRISQPSA